MKTIIRAAVESGRPPLELLLDQPGRKRDKWDGKLIKALYLNEAFEIEGHPIWVEESPDIEFVARKRDVRSVAVVEAEQDKESKKKNPKKGRRFYAEAKLKPGAKWPTRRAWLDRKNSVPDEVQAEDAKAAGRAQAAEERAARRVQDNPEVQRIVMEVQDKLKSRAGRLDQ